MKRLILALFSLLVMASISVADDGFIKSGDWWYTTANPGVPHKRIRHDWGEWVYSYNGCRCAPYYANYYYYTYEAVAVKDQVPSLDDPYFERKLADIMQRGQLHNQRLELLQQLGLTPSRWASPSTMYLDSGNPFLGNYGAQGTTVYGRGQVESKIDHYGILDKQVLFQNAYSYGTMANASFDKAAAGYNRILQTQLEGDARLAEIRERRATAVDLMRLVQPTPRTQLTTTVSGPVGTTVGVQSGVNGVGTAAPPLTPAFLAATKSCVACHGDKLAKPAGGYRVSQHWSLTREQRQRIFSELLMTGDMPRSLADPSKPSGTLLPVEQAIEFLDPADRAEALKELQAKGEPQP